MHQVFLDLLILNAMEKIDRKPAVAGQFYPVNPVRLESELNSLFEKAEPTQHQQVRAIISPHAGYVFSGKVAASVFNQIDPGKRYKRIFIIGSSHQQSFEGASIYCDGDFLMPYGNEKVDTLFCRNLIESFPHIFSAKVSPHKREHSLEVQLPFLHHVLKNEYSIVPIILGTSDPEVCKEIARALKPWFRGENLFIISSDFSHYPNASNAQTLDNLTKEAILSNRPEKLLATLKDNACPHLDTSLCGWTSVVTLMYMTSGNGPLEYHAIDYQNSGESILYGDKNRVVGYWGIYVSEKQEPGNAVKTETKKEPVPEKTEFMLTPQEKKTLLELARKTIEEKIRNGRMFSPDTSTFTQNMKANCGAFVSLHINGKLRGCIGRMIGDIPLHRMIQEMAVSSAINDPRFYPVSKEELPTINIELSVLSPLKKITDSAEIELGKHGIYIAKGRKSGVFLPQVATETKWTLDDFLGHCSRDKAGMEWDGWKTADVFIFTADVFHEEDTFHLKNT